MIDYEDAWNELLSNVKWRGKYHPWKFTNPHIEFTVDILGGETYICDNIDKKYIRIKHDFISILLRLSQTHSNIDAVYFANKETKKHLISVIEGKEPLLDEYKDRLYFFKLIPNIYYAVDTNDGFNHSTFSTGIDAIRWLRFYKEE